ncbi:alpha/beta hydrolase family protein [Liquorilactobacillus mali]|uniref:S9 family peptidase n=1 Tax=Liquorilactobacillus mali TaxID=1618 RepID=UPI002350137D|nr:S9 family peptidase [Liquorilactobacillus mali]MDC7952879.1 S9 family peptidase [Liquorilactobacillus mali]
MVKTVQIEDLYHFESLASPTYNLMGNKLLYVQTKMVRESDNYISSIHLYDLNKKVDEEIIQNGSLNIEPKWAGKDKGFYYISNKNGSKQIYYYDFLNRIVKQLTFAPTGVLDFEVNPVGKYLFYLTQMNKVTEDKAFITTRAFYKANNHGLIEDDDHLRKLWVYGIDDGSSKYLTSVNHGFEGRKAFTISPDGKKLVFKSKIKEGDDFNFAEELRLLVLNENCSKIVQNESLTNEFSKNGTFSDPCFSKDGAFLGFLGNENAYKNSNQSKVYIYDFNTKKVLDFCAKKDMQAFDSCVSDFHQNNTNQLLQWNEKLSCFVFVVSEDGKVCLYSANPEDNKIWKVTDGKEHIQDFTINQESGNIAIVVSRPDLPVGLFERRVSGEQLELDVGIRNQEADYIFAKYKSFEFENSEGGKVPCFFALPPSLKNGDKIPLVLDIHGGPHAMHGYTFHHEVQVLAAKQMAVLLVNPRGSLGYGQDFADGVVGKYGQGDYRDLMLAVDKVLKLFPVVDQTKIFVTGGSYGGFMTNWIVGHTNRFKRAATQRSISNFVSMSGTSDIGYWFNTSESGGFNILQPRKLWEESPIAYINNVKTPTLVLHSDQDLRCPIEQGQQWFVALKTLGIPTKFVQFFNESHELSRSGKPSNRCKRLSEIINCFVEDNYFNY